MGRQNKARLVLPGLSEAPRSGQPDPQEGGIRSLGELIGKGAEDEAVSRAGASCASIQNQILLSGPETATARLGQFHFDEIEDDEIPATDGHSSMLSQLFEIVGSTAACQDNLVGAEVHLKVGDASMRLFLDSLVDGIGKGLHLGGDLGQEGG